MVLLPFICQDVDCFDIVSFVMILNISSMLHANMNFVLDGLITKIQEQGQPFM